MANKSRKGVKNRDKLPFTRISSTSGTSGTAPTDTSKKHGKKDWDDCPNGSSVVNSAFPSEDSSLSSCVVSHVSNPNSNPNPSIVVVSSPSLSVEKGHASHAAHAAPVVKSTLQPTSEQMMIAQLISHEEDPKHKVKIQNVMDITNKEEDEVATALFDCAWDESKAIEFLLDSNAKESRFGEWEETGKKKKKNKQQAEDKNAAAEDWDDHAASPGDANANNTTNFNSQSDSNREKSRQRGPPRMRRGGSNAGGRGGSRGGGADRSSSSYNGHLEAVPTSAGEAEGGMQPGHHHYHHHVGQQQRSSRGGAPPRRGGGRGGERGGRSSNYQPRYDHRSNAGGNPGGNAGGGGQGGAAQAFSGSIDTWNPSGDHSEQTSSNNGKKSRHNNKDAFDNAGNWGDDFPAAEDWDNEEYTGSLADTKVFTAKNTSGPKMPSAVGQNRGAAPSSQSGNSQQQAQPQGGASSSESAQQPSTYSQSIDLSTLLQKPTTQSSLTNPPQNLLQFQQQGGVGLSPASSQAQGSNSGGKGDLYYSSQQSSAGAGGGGGSYSALIKSSGSGGPTTKSTPQVISNSKSRLPPPSKIPSSAVEMPGDSLTKLDVQFGGLDLQFGASTTGDSSGTNGGFDFGSTSNNNSGSSSSSTGESSSKYLSSGSSDKSKLDVVYSSSAPSAKEVTKSLASKIDSSIGFDRSSKGGSASASSNNNASATSYKTQEVINNFNNSSSNPSYSSYPSQPGQQGSVVQKQSSGKTYHPPPGGANNNYNQFPQYSNQSNGSYANNGSQQAQPYTQAVNGGSSSSSSSANSGPSSSSSNYPSSNVSTANYNSNYNNSVSSSSSVPQSYGSKGNSYEATSTSLKNDYPQSNSLGGVVPGGSTATALGLTSTTNALSGKISATSASGKVNLSNFPPGVASMLPTQYMIGNAQAGIPPFYGLQQHMYSTYNASTASGIEELAALQRGAAAAGLHTLPTTGYYDPNSQFANSLAAATSGGSRADGSTSGSAGSNSINSLNDKNFGANSNSVGGGNESTSSPIPSTLASAVAAATTPAAAQAAARVAAAAQQQSFSLNTFAPQQTAIPAPYAYYFGPGLQAYGSGVYPAAPMNVVPTAAGGTASTQFQKTGYGSSYASAYENLGQQVNKEFNPTYSSGTGNNKVPTGGVAAGSSSNAPGKGGHQYWNNATNHLSSQLWG